MEDKVPILQNAISVSELNATIKACTDSPIFKGILLFGEVSGYKLSGAHAYFTLKDQYSQISCVRFNAVRGEQPKEGDSVILKGSLDYYIKGGRLSFQVSEITLVGKGLLFLQFERLRQKLTEEGLFDEAHKRPVPQYAKNVLVVTSKTGAVIRDIVTTIRRKNPIMDIVLRDVRVQGEGAARDISSVLARVDRLGYDVIILARGGGSLEDLAPFYDEELVRTIYKMQTPVVSAIGHETDFSLADFVADARAATPTAAAELVAYDYYALLRRVKELNGRLLSLINRQFERKQMRLRLSVGRLGQLAESFYTSRSNRVRLLITRINTLTAQKLERAERRVENAMTALDNLSPLKTLKRGYFAVEKDRKQLVSVADVSVGDRITVTGKDGKLFADVAEIIPHKEEKV